MSREAIVAATLRIVDADGAEAVTMRRVAAELGVTAPSLYAHVAKREDLLTLAVAHVFDEVGEAPDTGDWRADLRAYFLDMHARLAVHRDLVRYAFAGHGTPSGDDDLARLETLLARLDAVGVPVDVAAGAFDRLLLYTIADVYEQARYAEQDADEDIGAWREEMRGYIAALPRERYPHVRASAHVIVDPGVGRERFALGLDLILDGVAARAVAPGGDGGAGA